MLLRAADQGRGILLTILLIWSLIGWILLTVLFVSIGGAIDWIGGIAVGMSTSTR